jgi:hypothetical protein
MMTPSGLVGASSRPPGLVRRAQSHVSVHVHVLRLDASGGASAAARGVCGDAYVWTPQAVPGLVSACAIALWRAAGRCSSMGSVGLGSGGPCMGILLKALSAAGRSRWAGRGACNAAPKGLAAGALVHAWALLGLALFGPVGLGSVG